jgi:predicted CXXCH cytochrome family protein
MQDDGRLTRLFRQKAGSRIGILSAALGAAAVVLGLAAAITFAADGVAPEPPGSLTAVVGSSAPIVAKLSWTASTGASGYVVYASEAADGPYDKVGATAGLSFDYADGFAGTPYWFRVVAVDGSGDQSTPAQAGPITATWKFSPHNGPTRDTKTCAKCHVLHDAAAGTLLRSSATTSSAAQIETCYQCHDGRGANADIKAGPIDSFGLTSGHTLETSPTVGELTADCSSCHSLHRPASTVRMLPGRSVNGTEVASAGPEWCLACHDETNKWYAGTYPPAAVPTRNAAGYPVAGTWPGPRTYESTSNAHRLIQEATQTPEGGDPIRRQQGDCLYCHAAHRGSNTYDGLLGTFRPTTQSTLASDQAQGVYAAACFQCHGGVRPSGFTTTPVDIKQFVTAAKPNAGHRIETSGGVLPVGSPLPCYECHGPHGSTRGNASLISDTLGQDLSTATDSDVRHFCFTCHSTADTGRGWDSVAATYSVVSASNKVVGLPRNGGVLKLPAVAGHTEADTQACSACHGNNYREAGGVNVHNPGTGSVPEHISPTTSSCFGAGCHDSSKSLPEVHALYAGPGSERPQYANSCELCHENENPNRIDWTQATAQCTGVCHSGTTHSQYNAKHALTAASDECVSCHESDISVVHGAGTGDFTKCATCHDNVSNWAKTGDCTGCHNGTDVGTHAYTPADPNHYSEATHTATPFTGTVQSAGPDGLVAAGGEECSTCHSSTLKAAHSSTSTSGGSVTCAECHTDTTLGSSAVVASNWSTRTCVECHDTGAATTHDSYATTHTVSAGSCAGTGTSCHNYTDLAQLHANSQSGGMPKYRSCTNTDSADPTGCHTSLDKRPTPVDPAASCGEGTSGCHQEKTTTNHGYEASTHTGNLGTGVVPLFSDHEFVGPVAYGVVCSDCHSSELGPTHADICSTCHPVARGSFTSWNKTCSQAACHPTYHANSVAIHDAAASGNCGSCHDETNFDLLPNPCANCHEYYNAADTIAPVTISNVLTAYVGAARIIFSVTDNGNVGVATTFYRIDGGSTIRGDSAVVADAGSHTIEFWSVDQNGNEELPHKSALFTTTADSVAPITSSNARPAYEGPAAITLSASDSSTVGVKNTYYSLNGAPATAGTTISLTPPAAGTDTYILTFWSEDYSGNVETPNVTTFTVTRDVTAPSTTCDALEGQTYTVAQTFHLTATDTGTGVASTWYKLDGAPSFTRYTTGIGVPLPASGSAAHTISWYSIDRAGNTESTKSVNFSMSVVAVAPDPPTLINLPPDGSSFVYGEEDPPSYTLQWTPVTAPDGDPCTYQLELVTQSPWSSAFRFATATTPISLTGTSYTIPQCWGAFYYWQVRAVDALHPGLISQPSTVDLFIVNDGEYPYGSPYLGPYN